MQYTVFLAILALANAIPSLPQPDNSKPAYRPLSFYNMPLIRAQGAVIASAEAENDDVSAFAGYGEPIATEAEIPKTADAFLIASPPQVQLNVQPSEYKAPAQIGVAPKFTGGFRTPLSESVRQFGGGKGAITNPAAFFMEGADLEKVAKPKCQMIGCDGPVANDEDMNLVLKKDLNGPDSQCHKTFVAMNGCVDGKGYPVGMICTICCDCSASLKLELSKSRGFKEGFRTDLN
ncbi:unnamed protein product [Bursaphelenchus xylophilus]|uniref:(pine wood nematode) hypothetical protein n=1 Tax=Bursaphelenchus xylophilus TaxID=6326 RepID=A0A1I7RP10_BURXY|nr:unnamed protein product [Bursaphelenchus xylophilus]CAG9124437.1 unnamed protein product [Bursaphelenchus xylophilus]